MIFPNVILHPVTRGHSEKHYLETVKNPIEEKRQSVLRLATSEERELLERHHGDGDLRAWGVTDDSRWKRIQPGDIGLFYTGGKQELYTGKAIVTFKARNPDIAKELWPDEKKGKSWEWLYFMRDFEEISIPVKELNRVAGYKETYRLRGTDIPKEKATSENVIRKLLNEGPMKKMQGKLPSLENESSFSDIHEYFSGALRKAGLQYGSDHEQLVRSFLASFVTKPFVILTGLSGSGKTQIAMRFGEWLGKKRSRLVPVRPDWTGSEAVFGYEDILQPVVDGRRAWHVPRPLQFILQAARKPEAPHLLILDEMNLAHVERYLADFLSGLESRKPCIPNLRQETDGCWRVDPAGPDLVGMPENLWLVGTVNVDETTYMFSPKVLDRANTFEFRVQTDDLRSHLSKPTPCEQGRAEDAQKLLAISKDPDWHLENPPRYKSRFEERMRLLHEVLCRGGYEFGHRVFFETVRFAAVMEAMGEPDDTVALDFQVLQKILPRLNGSRRELEPTLCTMGRFCYSLDVDGGVEGGARFDPVNHNPGQAKLPRSFHKVKRMTQKLRANQFVSFTE